MEPQSGQLAQDLGSVLKDHPPKIRVLLDARKISDGGIGVYTASVAAGLIASGEVDLTLLIAKPEALDRFWWASSVDSIVDAAKPYSLDEYLMLPRRVNFGRFDVFHVPHYTLPFGVPIPTVITLHDLIHVSHPEHFYYPLLAKRLIRSAVNRAKHVITVSHSTLRDLQALVGSEKLQDKVSVVPNALDPEIGVTRAIPNFLADRFKIRGNFLLSVISMLKPHKGLVDLLDAFEDLKSHLGNDPALEPLRDIRLVLVGRAAEQLSENQQLLIRAGNIEGVHILGSVTKDELIELYRGARGLVVSSKAEGFCLPALEAHAVGTPVISRPVPAVLELLGARDVVAKDFSTAELTKSMLEFCRRLVEEKSKRGGVLYDLSRYDCRTIGKSVVSVYRRVSTSEN